jgi:delta-aminolevulinic acid dehydratase/porphobilinogen synthase
MELSLTALLPLRGTPPVANTVALCVLCTCCFTLQGHSDQLLEHDELQRGATAAAAQLAASQRATLDALVAPAAAADSSNALQLANQQQQCEQQQLEQQQQEQHALRMSEDCTNSAQSGHVRSQVCCESTTDV